MRANDQGEPRITRPVYCLRNVPDAGFAIKRVTPLRESFDIAINCHVPQHRDEYPRLPSRGEVMQMYLNLFSMLASKRGVSLCILSSSIMKSTHLRKKQPLSSHNHYFVTLTPAFNRGPSSAACNDSCHPSSSFYKVMWILDFNVFWERSQIMK